jgi:hypothetical protein
LQVRLNKTGASEVGVAQVGVFQVGFVKVVPAQVFSAQVSSAQVGMLRRLQTSSSCIVGANMVGSWLMTG